MRTSYQKSNSKEVVSATRGSVEDNIDLEKESLRASLRDAYVTISSAVIESRKQQELKDISEAIDAQTQSSLHQNSLKSEDFEGTDNEDVSEEEEKLLDKKKKRNRKIIVASSITGVILVAVTGFVVYRLVFNSGGNVDAIQTQIDKLYTSEERTDIKEGVEQEDLNQFYMDLLKAQDKGADVDSTMEELDTIGYFLSDKSKLERFNGESYDLTTAGMMDSIEDIKENAQKYSVPGLALSINSLATDVEEDYDYFIDLRTELNGIIDVLSFDEDAYTTKISEVDHIPNRTELEATYDKIVVDKQAAQAQQELQDAQDEQAKQEAQKALEEVQELQRQTQQELEDTKKQLEEAAQKAAEQEKEQESLDSKPIEPTTSPSITEEPTITISPESTSTEEDLNNSVSSQNLEENVDSVESTSAEE